MMTQDRVTPRQAIVVLDVPSLSELTVSAPGRADSPTELQPYALLDVIGTLVGVDGASISIVCQSPARARTLHAALPAGVDLMVPEPGRLATEGALISGLQHLLDRAFSRIVAIAGDTLAVPSRLVATALGSLSTADLVIGQTLHSGVYLVGVRDQAGISLLLEAGAAPNWSGLDPRVLHELAKPSGTVVRHVESRMRLSDLTSPETIRAALEDSAGLAPRMTAALAGEPYEILA
ncbi:MAG: DUF2064 domain-containing protein [Thermomicrobiales bacterium]